MSFIVKKGMRISNQLNQSYEITETKIVEDTIFCYGKYIMTDGSLVKKSVFIGCFPAWKRLRKKRS